jgi:hypothetical protein
VQVAGRDPHRVPTERLLFEAELPADEGHDPFRDDLATAQEPARMAQDAELQREAEPVGLPPAPADDPEILLAQHVVAGEIGVVLR